MKKGKTYITISARTCTAMSLKAEVNVKPLYLCTHTKRKVVVQQCHVVSAAVIFGTTRREEKRGIENGEYWVVFSFLLLSLHFWWQNTQRQDVGETFPYSMFPCPT